MEMFQLSKTMGLWPSKRKGLTMIKTCIVTNCHEWRYRGLLVEWLHSGLIYIFTAHISYCWRLPTSPRRNIYNLSEPAYPSASKNMKTLITFLVMFFGILSLVGTEQKTLFISYPKDTPESAVDAGMRHILKAGGKITVLRFPEWVWGRESWSYANGWLILSLQRVLSRFLI